MPRQYHPIATPSRRRRSSAFVLAGVAGLAVAALAGVALAKSFTVEVASNVKVGSKHEAIVVTSKGVAVYELIGETKQNPLCTGGCLTAWPPVKASAHAKLTKALGVKGTLGTWHRTGFTQLTLNGHLLYTFAGDMNKKGVATGDGIQFPGAVWHVVLASPAKKATNVPHTTTSVPTSTSTPTTPSTPTTTSPYPPGW
jgi:predicted lipoprotein with Yx(FWY)xxD motif